MLSQRGGLLVEGDDVEVVEPFTDAVVGSDVVVDFLCFLALATVAGVSAAAALVSREVAASGDVAPDGDRDWAVDSGGIVPGAGVPGIGAVPGRADPGSLAPGVGGAAPDGAAPGAPADAAPGWPALVCARAGIARTVAKAAPKINALRISLSFV